MKFKFLKIIYFKSFIVCIGFFKNFIVRNIGDT